MPDTPPASDLLRLHCPACRQPLIFRTTLPEDVACDCGARYQLHDGVLDFNVREQEVANTWSKPEPDRSDQARVQSWLDAGLITTTDLENIEAEIAPEQMKSAFQQGIKALQDVMNRTAAEGGPLPPEGPVLDLCTGMGSLYRDPDFLSRPRPGLTVLTDLSRFALTAVRKRLAGIPAAGRWALLACDVRQLPLADESVALAVSVGGFQNVESATGLLHEVRRVLIPGASLLTLCVFVEEASRSLRLSDHIGCGELATRQRMKDALARNGFGKISVDVILDGIFHERGDLIPLHEDKAEIALVSAVEMSDRIAPV